MSSFKRPDVSRLALALIAPWIIATAARAATGDLADVQRLLKAGQAAEALRRIEQQSSANTDVQWRFVKAVALTDLARPAEAIKIYTRLIEERPELPEPRNNLAVLYAQQGQFDKARVTFESALRTSQVYAAAYDNLGDVHARLATASYARALQVNDAASAGPPQLAQVRELGGAAPPPVLVAQAPAPKAAPAAASAATAPAPKPTPAAPAASAAAAPAAAPAPKPAASAPVVVAAPPAPPAAAPAPAVRNDAQSAAQLREAVVRWSTAWSQKNLDGYFAAYQPAFNGGKSRSVWMAERKARISGKAQIAVTVSGLVMEIDGDKARVQFHQNYRSDRLNVDSSKTLHFVRTGGKWLIDKETAG